MLQAVADGTVDAIITDHAPHSAEEKADFEKAPNGVVGLETSLAGCITALVEPGIIPLMRLVEMMTVNPARILGLPVPTLQAGAPADIVLFDPTRRWVVDPEKFHSKSKNTVFGGETLTGRVKYTIFGGQIVYRDNN
jgi:dihydroorotase